MSDWAMDPELIFYALLAGAAVPLWIAIRRSTELFVVRISQGRCRLMRGRLPPALWVELVDVVERAHYPEGTIKCFLSRGSPTVDCTGEISPTTVQQLRNVIGRFPLPRIKTGTRRA